MPAEKTARSSLRKRIRNRSVRSSTRTTITVALNLIDGGDQAQAETAVSRAQTALDKAAKRGVLHPNNAARRKSRLMKRLNALKKGP